MNHEDWLQMAVRMATKNVTDHGGGPFAALVVRQNELVGVGCNEVTTAHDATAHAEMQAIRAACRALGHFQLTDCVIYTSCEPCPMCFGAIYWARPNAVYYACTKQQAAASGFDDQWIYEQLAVPAEHRSIRMEQIYPPGSDMPFQAWAAAEQKTRY